MPSSEYVNEQRRNYSLYVVQQRAIPALTDGLKPAARRLLWTARDGKKYKSATLAGATMPLHPHAEASGTVNTLASPYNNNIPLFTGIGAFGTLLKPKAYGASRYTSVKLSEFAKDVLFKDVEIIPMMENYDGTMLEPKHFLPLIPLSLLNPSEGIAVGFACNIVPRSLSSIIATQLQYLCKPQSELQDVYPFSQSLNQEAVEWKSPNKWIFHGKCELVNTTTVKITQLPYGVCHDKFTTNLNKLIDTNAIVDYVDNSSNEIDVIVKFKRGVVPKLSHTQLLKMLGLINACSENMNVVNLDHQSIWGTDFVETIKRFTDWRLEWYEARYQRLADITTVDIQRYKDIISAIDKNLGNAARKVESRSELKELLSSYNIVHVDYVADLPLYRFTKVERDKTSKKLEEALETLQRYQQLLDSESERRKVYVSELKHILKQHGE